MDALTARAKRVLTIPKFRLSLILLVFGMLIFFIYSGTLKSPFIFDDTKRILENQNIRLTQLSLKNIVSAGFKSSKTRPIAFSSFAVNYYFNRYDPWGYHLINISVHILTAFILYLFLKTTLTLPSIDHRYQRPALIAFFAALIWLVHPVHTQSVIYIVQRMNSLAAMLFILSFWFYVRGRLAANRYRRWPWFAGAMLTWLVSLGCKQITVTLPFVVYLYEWYFFQNLNTDWLKRSLKYVLVLVALAVLLALIYTGFNPWEKISRLNDYAQNEFTILQRSLTQLRVVLHYISLLFYPHPSRLNLDYDFALSYSLINPVTTLVSLIVIVGLIALAFYLAQKQRLISFCILWFFVTLIIESSIIPLAIIFEHRLYLPSMLVVLVPVLLAYRYIKPEKYFIGLSCGLVIISGWWTFDRNRDWKDDLTIWTDTVEKSPAKARPHINLGKALAKRNLLDEAIKHYTFAIKIKPDYAKTYYNLGNALVKKDKANEAIARYNKALQLEPRLPEVHNNLGSALAKQGKSDQAIASISHALRLKPDYAEAHYNLAGVLFEKGMISEAIEHYTEATQLDPGSSDAHYNLAIALQEKDQTEKSIKHFYEALRLNPDYMEAHYNLGRILQRQNRQSEAAFHYESALSIQPKFVPALNNLAVLYAIDARYEMALDLFKKAVALQPENPGTYRNIARIYAIQNNVEESIRWLTLAVEKGYTDWNRIKKDENFKNITQSPQFKNVIEDR